ncbi:hypothetical protein NSQ26_07670 [Bacillus sp. FSL W7-1360]
MDANKKKLAQIKAKESVITDTVGSLRESVVELGMHSHANTHLIRDAAKSVEAGEFEETLKELIESDAEFNSILVEYLDSFYKVTLLAEEVMKEDFEKQCRDLNRNEGD